MERALIIGGIVAAFYLAIGSLLAHLLGLGDSPFLWVAVTLGWPVVVIFLGLLAYMAAGALAKVFRALPGRRA